MFPQLDPFEKSIMLLVFAEDVIKRRRLLEQMCGYSENYGNDNVLIKLITKHLNDSEIKSTADRVREILEMGEAEKRVKNKKSK